MISVKDYPVRAGETVLIPLNNVSARVVRLTFAAVPLDRKVAPFLDVPLAMLTAEVVG